MSNYKTNSVSSMSGIETWMIWLGIMMLVSIVIASAFFLSAEYGGLINLAMYAVIALLGFGLILKGYSDARFIQQQSNLASEQIQILECVDNMEDFLRQASSSLFRSHIENLHTIASSHVEVSQDNLIEILHARLVARNKVVELFSSILITLGLIGTILGLILMMDGLTAVMSNPANEDNLMSELVSADGPLSGLGVAFVTTLLGATLGGVILRVLTSVVDANIMNYIAHISELTEVYVLPHLRNVAADNGPTSADNGKV